MSYRKGDAGAYLGCGLYLLFTLLSFLICVVLPYAIIAHFVLKYW